jgi:multicomponent Na+:H+ antiporter subunit G
VAIALDVFAVILLAIGLGFFAAGTLGLLSFPDVYNRLHAMTKADNLGLGFVVAALALRAGSALAALELVGVWLLVVVAGSTACHLIAGRALAAGVEPWKER